MADIASTTQDAILQAVVDTLITDLTDLSINSSSCWLALVTGPLWQVLTSLPCRKWKRARP